MDVRKCVAEEIGETRDNLDYHVNPLSNYWICPWQKERFHTNCLTPMEHVELSSERRNRKLEKERTFFLFIPALFVARETTIHGYNDITKYNLL